MRCRGLALLAILFLVLLTACGRSDRSPTAEIEDSQEALGVIKGHLEFEALRSPKAAPRFEAPRLEEVKVYARSIDTADTYPGKVKNNGDYLITRLPGGRYNVIAETRNKIYGGISKEVDVTPGKTKEIQDVLFLSTQGRISGRVVLLGPKGERLPETGFVEVFIPGTSFSCRTTRKGEFTFYYIPAGEYTIVASCEGYEDTVVEGVEVALGSETQIQDFHLIPITPETGTLVGTVRDRPSWYPEGESVVEMPYLGKPIFGAKVTALKVNSDGNLTQVYTATTGRDGEYRIPNMKPGEYTVRAEAEGFEAEEKSATIKIKEVAAVDFYLPPISEKGIVFGTVMVAGYRKDLAAGDLVPCGDKERCIIPVEGAVVSLYPGYEDNEIAINPGIPWPWLAVTDKEGKYRIEGVPFGPYVATTEAMGFLPEKQEVTVSSTNPEVKVDFTLQPAKKTASIYGVVTYAGMEMPLPEADVTVTLFTGETFATRTDKSGKYRIDGLPASDAIILIYPPPVMGTVTASKTGYDSQTVDLPALTSGEERRINLCLAPIGEEPQLTYSNSGCLNNREDPTNAADKIIAKVKGNNVYVTHRNAWYNCCLEEIRVELEQEGNQLKLIETEILEGSGCRCMCLYNVSATISDLAAGEHVIQVLNEDQGLIGEITVTVP